MLQFFFQDDPTVLSQHAHEFLAYEDYDENEKENETQSEMSRPKLKKPPAMAKQHIGQTEPKEAKETQGKQFRAFLKPLYKIYSCGVVFVELL